MKSSKYDSETRKALKSAQRSAVYRDLQQRVAEERSLLEGVLRQRNATIALLKKKLLERGLLPSEIDKLAA
jgi:hypothetical protein